MYFSPLPLLIVGCAVYLRTFSGWPSGGFIKINNVSQKEVSLGISFSVPIKIVYNINKPVPKNNPSTRAPKTPIGWSNNKPIKPNPSVTIKEIISQAHR